MHTQRSCKFGKLGGGWEPKHDCLECQCEELGPSDVCQPRPNKSQTSTNAATICISVSICPCIDNMTIFLGKGGGGGFVAKSDSCDPMDCSLPGSPVPGILQARIQGKVGGFEELLEFLILHGLKTARLIVKGKFLA